MHPKDIWRLKYNVHKIKGVQLYYLMQYRWGRIFYTNYETNCLCVLNLNTQQILILFPEGGQIN